MKLTFFQSDTLDKNLKATIQKTGKLGFTIEAAKKMDLSNEKSIGIAYNEEDEEINDLYIIVNDEIDKKAFKVNKAGEYHYVNTKALFDKLKWDYTKESISFDITEEKIDGKKFFKFTRRKKKSKEKYDFI